MMVKQFQMVKKRQMVKQCQMVKQRQWSNGGLTASMVKQWLNSVNDEMTQKR